MDKLENVIECIEKAMVFAEGENERMVTTCYGVMEDALALLKEQEKATIEPKRIDLPDETKAWLDKMDAVDALGNIASICMDWDGYRTANGLGGLINEIWAYARYCADRLQKAQEPIAPVKVNRYMETDENGDWFSPETYDCGNCGVELHGKANYCHLCGRAVKWE